MKQKQETCIVSKHLPPQMDISNCGDFKCAHQDVELTLSPLECGLELSDSLLTNKVWKGTDSSFMEERPGR